MKKFLSMVLALVMTMSLVTISAGAKDFTDDSKITYDEAVAVISELGIVDGYTDGAFNPQNTLTRGAAAKIICNLVLGPTTASALTADAAPFKDVPANHEFAGYIAYCSQQGIINGYADGTFRPAGTLNGYAFMKMLLGALGYDGEIESFTGANWTINVAKLALGIKLNAGLSDEFNGNDAVNREEACLFAFNALQADMVQYDSKITANVNGAEVTIGNSKAEKILNSASGYDNTLKDSEGVLQFAERYFPKLTKTNNNTDSFGRPATEWKYKSQVIGSYTDYSTMIGEYNAKAKKGELYDLVGSSIVKELTPAGNRDGEYKLTVYVDGDEVSSPATGNYFDKNSSGAAGVRHATKGTGVSGNGVLTQVFMDDDNNVTIVMVNTFLVKATADYNTNTGKLNVEAMDINTDAFSATAGIMQPNMKTTIDNDDVYVADFKEGDYILVTYAYSSATAGEIKSAVKAEIVTAEVSEYTVTDNVVMGGEKYEYNKLVGDTESGVTYTIGEDAKVVVDEYGYILFVDEAVSTNSYVFLAEDASNSNSKTVKFNAYFTDGTMEEITAKRYDGDNSSSVIAGAKFSWATFSKDDAGRYSLNPVKTPMITGKKAGDPDVGSNTGIGSSTVSTTAVIVNGKVSFAPAFSGVKGDSSTIFVVREADDDVNAYTGVANVPDITLPTTGTANDQWVDIYAAYNKNTGYADYVFIDLTHAAGATVSEANSVSDHLFILKTTGNKTYVADDEYWQYKVLLDGEETTKYIAESIGATAGDLFRSVKENSKGYITDAKKYENSENDTDKRDIVKVGPYVSAATPMDTINYSNGTLTINGTRNDSGSDISYVIKDGAKGFLVIGKNVPKPLKNDDGASYEMYTGSISSIASVIKNYNVDAKVYLDLDDNGSNVATEVYIYVRGAEEAPNLNEASIDSVTLNGAEVTAYASAKSAADHAMNVVAGIDVKVEATGEGTIAYQLQTNYTSGDFSGSANDTTTPVDGQVDVFAITATSANGAKDVVRYVAVKGVIGKVEGVDTADATVTTADALKNERDGAYVFETIPTGVNDTNGIADQHIFFKFTTTEDPQTATLEIRDADGNRVYRESYSFTTAGGHFFYVQVAGTGLANAGSGSMKDSPLAVGDYTWLVFTGNTDLAEGRFSIG